jgi:hypothetical protein
LVDGIRKRIAIRAGSVSADADFCNNRKQEDIQMQRLKRFPISTLVVIFLIGLLPSLGYSQIQLDDPLLVFYFPLDEGGGDIIKDLGPNGLEGEIEGGPAWVDSVDKKFGTALSFIDGKEQSAFVADVPALDLGESDTTLAAWVKTGKEVGQGFVYIKWDGGGWYLKMWDNKLTVRFNVPGVGGGGVSSFSELADGQWHHCCTQRIDQLEVNVIIDGKVDAEDKMGSALGSVQTPANLEIGRFKEERFWNGAFDELFLIKRLLTLDEIKSLIEGDLLAVESKGKLPLTWGSLKAARQ